MSLYENFYLYPLIKFSQSWALNSYSVPFCLENSDRRKPAKCLSPGKEAKKIIHSFVSLIFLFDPIINILLTEREVCVGESWPRSLVQTSLRSVCTGNLGQNSPIQTSRSVYKI